MPIKIIQQLINGEYISQGQKVHVPVKSVVIEHGIAKNAGDLISGCGLLGKALIVSDVNTNAAMGEKIALALRSSCGAQPSILVFGQDVKAEIKCVEEIKAAAVGVDYIIAVGSGTINDLCKYASFIIGKPYAVFGTALSMNGYGSANASITVAGHKKSLPAGLPCGIFLDLEILAKAPLPLTRSGLGDSLCRSTAQADWLLAHLLLGNFYTNLPFILLQGFEADLLANSKALVNGDIEIMRLLAGNLVLSGFGMYLAGGSYPASQGEHMIAHTMEMAYGDALPHSCHGEQIGITTLKMSMLQEELLKNPLRLQQKAINASQDILKQFFGAQTGEECYTEYQAKQFSVDKIASINQRIENNFDSIHKEILSIMLPYNLLHKTLKDAGCPTLPENIGWSQDKYEQAFDFAKFSRSRFTFLDLK